MAQSDGYAWRLRDTITAATFFLASAAFVLWQNTRVAALWDLSYLLDSSSRMTQGQLPYRDFPFAHAPLTFLIHAAIIRIFGRVYLPHIVCGALEGGAAALLTWRTLLSLLEPFADRAWGMAALLASPLIFLGIYGVYPHPIYDSDCILAVLLAIYLLLRGGDRTTCNFLAGAACVLPLLAKQNIGILFFAATLLAVGVVAGVGRLKQQSAAPQVWVIVGAMTTLAAAVLTLHLTVGLHNYDYWTIHFARQRRLPGLDSMLSTYEHVWLLWTLPAAVAGVLLLRADRLRGSRWARAIAFVLLAAPFLWTIAGLALSNDPDDRADQLLSLWPHLLVLAGALALCNLRPGKLRAEATLIRLLPLILLATIHGTFLSQQLWGSTYAVWPLLLLLIAAMLAQVPTVARALAVTIAATFLCCGGLYAVSHERLDYLHLEGAEAHATVPELRGLTTPGPWIPDFEELIRATDTEIPAGDGILLLPGEDPFYFATGRTPRFPVLLFDPATDPYTPQQTADEARARNIRWLILERNPQLNSLPGLDFPEITRLLRQEFVLDRSVANYDIYRRK
jgi:hypothetical protein